LRRAERTCRVPADDAVRFDEVPSDTAGAAAADDDDGGGGGMPTMIRSMLNRRDLALRSTTARHTRLATVYRLSHYLVMAALRSRCGHYIFVLFLSIFFPRLISAVAD